MANNSFTTVPKDLKDEVALRRLFESMIKEIDRLRKEVDKLNGV